jgi:hypothetical protein
MAYQKLQVGRAIPVLPNSTYNFPNPSLRKINSTILGGTSTQIVDSAVDFIALNIQIGDLVWEIDGASYTVVTEIVDANTLNVADSVIGTGDTYSIYAYNQFESAVLYVGTGGNVEVQTVGGDTVIFSNVNSGQFLPVQVLRVTAGGTSANDIIALW